MKINRLFKNIALLSGLTLSFGGQAAISDSAVQTALKALYDSAGGSAWTNSSGWDAATIDCTAYGLVCDINNNVVELVLNDNNLVGPIPAQIGDLSNLVRLKLYNNQLNGSIPSELGSLSKLVELRLFSNDLEGPIPTSLSNLSNLLYLELNDNKLSGPVPAELGNLGRLWNFYVQGNQLIGDLPAELMNMGNTATDLLRLDFQWNAVISQDATLNSFINTNHINLIQYEDSQTLAPTGFALNGKSSTSVTLAWDSFQTNPPSPGGYKVLMATSEVGPFTQVIPDISDRFITNAQINNLTVGINYWFKICNFTSTHGDNLKNVVISEHSAVVSKGVPIVNAGADQIVNELDTVTLMASASDTDGGSIASYSWSLIGSGVIAGASSSSYSFTAPEVVSAGTVLVFRVTVTDNEGDIAYDDVQVTVNDVLPSVSAGADQTVNEGAAVSLLANASDSNGVIVTYTWEQVSGSTVTINNANTASADFTAPIIDSKDVPSEVLEFKITVTNDHSETVTDTVLVTVNNVLTPPTVDLGADQTVNEGASVTLSASASDNGNIVYSWSQVSGSSVVWEVSPTDPSILSFTAPQQPADTNEVLLFSVVVTDNDGMTATDQVQVTVNDVAPEVDITTDQPGNEIEEYTWIELIALANDLNKDIKYKYKWEQLIQNDEDIITLDPIDKPRTGFKAPGSKGKGNTRLYFRVTVTDDDGRTASADVYIIITKKKVVITGGGALGWPWLLMLGVPLLGRRFLN